MQKIETLVDEVQNILDAYNENKNIKHLLQLKKVLYPIDNLITLEVSYGFVKWLRKNNFISNTQANQMIGYLDNSNANANGFDIIYNEDGGMPILAEVKGTIPYLSNKYGSQQKDSIKKDLEYLTGKKVKLKSQSVEIEKYYKFMVMLKSQDENKDEAAMNNLLKTFHDKDNIIVLRNEQQTLNYDKVYVVFIELEN